MNRKGIFVVVDGPNGAGKSTVIEKCCEILDRLHIPYYQTKEPTKTELGQFIRRHQDVLSKEVLACLVAGNRYEHLSTTIIPQLEVGRVVITDRYFPSSLVYQRMDGLDISFIEALNSRILKPELTVLLLADEETLIKRLEERESLTRFESKDKKRREIQFYREAGRHLTSAGWNLLEIENKTTEIDKVTKSIADAILALRPADQ
jgi:dTMP kinase